MIATRSINLSEHEVLAALDDRLGLVVRPVRPTVKGCKVGAYYTSKCTVEPVNVQEDGDPWDDIPCPFGGPGDRLVCRETWKNRWGHEFNHIQDAGDILYRADGEYLTAKEDAADEPWRSPATMPAWASRITLEVEGVKVCRAFDLTGKDSLAWGLTLKSKDEQGVIDLARECRDAWNHRYGKRYPWESSPWVWAVNVKRVLA